MLLAMFMSHRFELAAELARKPYPLETISTTVAVVPEPWQDVAFAD